jgi:hypothetical protein
VWFPERSAGRSILYVHDVYASLTTLEQAFVTKNHSTHDMTILYNSLARYTRIAIDRCPHHFFPSLGLKKLVNLLILLVLTFFRLSTPLDPGCTFRFVPALRAASDLD